MTKPHEQEWKVEQSSMSSKTEVVGPDVSICRVNVTYSSKGSYMTADMDDATAKANLIAAAPDMARALLTVREVLGGGGDVEEMMTVIGAALRKAGVLP